jgi:hypothetical protein
MQYIGNNIDVALRDVDAHLPKCAARVTGCHLQQTASKLHITNSDNNPDARHNSHLHPSHRDAATVSQLWQQPLMLECSAAQLH